MFWNSYKLHSATSQVSGKWLTLCIFFARICTTMHKMFLQIEIADFFKYSNVDLCYYWWKKTRVKVYIFLNQTFLECKISSLQLFVLVVQFFILVNSSRCSHLQNNFGKCSVKMDLWQEFQQCFLQKYFRWNFNLVLFKKQKSYCLNFSKKKWTMVILPSFLMKAKLHALLYAIGIYWSNAPTYCCLKKGN